MQVFRDVMSFLFGLRVLTVVVLLAAGFGVGKENGAATRGEAALDVGEAIADEKAGGEVKIVILRRFEKNSRRWLAVVGQGMLRRGVGGIESVDVFFIA